MGGSVGIPPRGPPPEYPFPNRGSNMSLTPGATPLTSSHPSLGVGVSTNNAVSASPVVATMPSSATSAPPPMAAAGQSPSGSVYFGHDPKENGMALRKKFYLTENKIKNNGFLVKNFGLCRANRMK